MFLFSRADFYRNSILAAAMFAAFGVGAASAQDITPGSSVMESKARRPPAKAKVAPRPNSAPTVAKPTAKPNKTVSAPRAKNSPAPTVKNAKPVPEENAEETITRLDLEIVSAAPPVYPGAAKQAGAAGNVRVEVVVDENGDVISAQATDGHELLRSPSEKAALLTKFTPRKVKGKAVQTRGYLTYCFGSKCD